MYNLDYEIVVDKLFVGVIGVNNVYGKYKFFMIFIDDAGIDYDVFF